MAVSLKDICDEVLGESGFLIPPAYINGSPDDVQMAYLANAAAAAAREKAPQVSRRTFVVTLTSATTYTLPSDFLGMVPDTAYVNGRLDPVRLPTSATEWHGWLASNGATGIEVRARFLGDVLQVLNPHPGDELRFEYMSSHPWVSALGPGGTAKERATLDTDLCVIDRRLIVTGTKWLWKKEKGLPDWEVDRAEWLQQLNAWRARDQGAQAVQFGEPVFREPEPYTNLWVNG